jgi:hypothetical protein
LHGAEFKNDRLVNTVEEISNEPNFQTAAWILLALLFRIIVRTVIKKSRAEALEKIVVWSKKPI